MTTDYTTGADLITGASFGRGLGFIRMDLEHNGKTAKLFGHAVLGGQNARVDLDNEISLAYMSNHLKVGLGDTARTYLRLLDALYECLDELN